MESKESNLHSVYFSFIYQICCGELSNGISTTIYRSKTNPKLFPTMILVMDQLQQQAHVPLKRCNLLVKLEADKVMKKGHEVVLQ
jgi:hypothetical protein